MNSTDPSSYEPDLRVFRIQPDGVPGLVVHFANMLPTFIRAQISPVMFALGQYETVLRSVLNVCSVHTEPGSHWVRRFHLTLDVPLFPSMFGKSGPLQPELDASWCRLALGTRGSGPSQWLC